MTWTTLNSSNVSGGRNCLKQAQTIAIKFTCSWKHVGFVVAVLSRVSFVQCMFCRGGFDVVRFVVGGFVWIPPHLGPYFAGLPT